MTDTLNRKQVEECRRWLTDSNMTNFDQRFNLRWNTLCDMALRSLDGEVLVTELKDMLLELRLEVGWHGSGELDREGFYCEDCHQYNLDGKLIEHTVLCRYTKIDRRYAALDLGKINAATPGYEATADDKAARARDSDLSKGTQASAAPSNSPSPPPTRGCGRRRRMWRG